MAPARVAIEGDRDRPPGAGVSPERLTHQPRAYSERGKDGNESKDFYKNSSRMPMNKNPAWKSAKAELLKPAHKSAPLRSLEEFREQARLSNAKSLSSRRHDPEQIEPVAPGGDDSELERLLSLIEDEVNRLSAAGVAGIMNEFAGRIDSARKSLPREQLPGAIRAIKEALATALAAFKRQIALELSGRREAAKKAHRARLASARKQQPQIRKKPSSPGLG
jgi:hypothetical protein